MRQFNPKFFHEGIIYKRSVFNITQYIPTSLKYILKSRKNLRRVCENS